ncbi:S-methyl-5-thioribose-1-phosphate isomerase [Dehalococcoidia bacterium]|nr:S-methyl-5-thioribose-1-phosphate isomerase [Dehalococcoidia bacterium]MCL0104594.1 S-methyl-5-thioribose-1-phosphate isomerase [Dehalococcoidia bacterium]
MPVKPVEWRDTVIRVLDQTRLPAEVVFLDLADYAEVAKAIREMRVRGAPAIGVAAAYGLALGAQAIEAGSREEFLSKWGTISRELASTRPTAVNLFWALDRMTRAAGACPERQEILRYAQNDRKRREGSAMSGIKAALVEEAKRIERENEEADRRIGLLGAELIEDGFTILTHCNAGALATAGYGTALGVIKTAREQGKRIQVFADETRPLLQGARLTAWELVEAQIPVTLITDSMAGHFMSQGKIDCVVVGADRIAANGDVANKIGTYSVAVLAKENAVPFYVAAPTSTIDPSVKSGTEIPIEERSADEVTRIGGARIAPDGVGVANPAFDVTPHRYVTAIITEQGIAREPYIESLGRRSQCRK